MDRGVDGSQSGEDAAKLRSSCHCGATEYNFQVSTASLPLIAYLCHCNISRRISGVLCTSYVPIHNSNPPPNLSALTSYKSSSTLKRHFCSTCGCQRFLEYNADGHFEVSTGTVSRGSGNDGSNGVIQFNGNMWIEDSRDGGASIWFRSYVGKPVERWLVAPNSSPQVPLYWRLEPRPPVPTEDKLYASCHCGGVGFFVSRPNDSSYEARSPYPDLMVPYISKVSSENPKNEAWWISQDGKRYIAGACACKSCRTTSGFDFVEWAFVPAVNISLRSGEAFHGQIFDTVKTYRSSSHATRWFCSICGANVFWLGDERPTLIDVAVGLLNAKSGARAEEWLQWISTRVSFVEEAHNEPLIKAIESGMQDWQPESVG